MYLTVKEVKAQENYQLLIIYSNGEKRQFNMQPYLAKGIFSELKDVELFRQVRPVFDSVEWSNEADIDPEILYNQSIKII